MYLITLAIKVYAAHTSLPLLLYHLSYGANRTGTTQCGRRVHSRASFTLGRSICTFRSSLRSSARNLQHVEACVLVRVKGFCLWYHIQRDFVHNISEAHRVPLAGRDQKRFFSENHQHLRQRTTSSGNESVSTQRHTQVCVFA